jgi:hypothetical protein
LSFHALILCRLGRERRRWYYWISYSWTRDGPYRQDINRRILIPTHQRARIVLYCLCLLKWFGLCP